MNNNYCPIPGASQPKEPVRLIDANSILRLINISGSAYDGIEYQAYEAGVEYVRGLIEDAPTIDPESLPTAHIMRELCLIHTMMRFAAIAVHILVLLALITKIMIRF